jgi:AcrR family transcriptional regulator
VRAGSGPGADRRRQILAAAERLLDAEGADAITMRRLAEAVGIRAPSLYKHFAGKAALEHAMVADGQAELARMVVLWAGERGGDLARIARGCRRFALERPHLYRLMTGRELDRDLLPPGLEVDGSGPLEALLGGRDRARAAWAFVHGMVSLELAGRFPKEADLDAAWAAGVATFTRPTEAS